MQYGSEELDRQSVLDIWREFEQGSMTLLNLPNRSWEMWEELEATEYFEWLNQTDLKHLRDLELNEKIFADVTYRWFKDHGLVDMEEDPESSISSNDVLIQAPPATTSAAVNVAEVDSIQESHQQDEKAVVKLRLSLIVGVQDVLQEIIDHEEESPLAKSLADGMRANLELLMLHVAQRGAGEVASDRWVTRTLSYIGRVRNGLEGFVRDGTRAATLYTRLGELLESFGSL